MLVDDIVNGLKPKLESTTEFLNNELMNVHTGRATVGLVDSIVIDVYGSKQSIKQIANISIPEPRQILIQPWDRTITGQIESAIRDSKLGFSPVNTGDMIRVTIPELTEDRRKEFIKLIKEKAEEARVSIRNARSESWNVIKKAKVDGEIGEDDMYRGENRIQELVDKYNQQIENMLEKKEKELMEI
jgi:ribosome recycling factor